MGAVADRIWLVRIILEALGHALRELAEDFMSSLLEGE